MIHRSLTIALLILVVSSELRAQSKPSQAELVMSMSQRSLVMPGYLTELKALIAKQAYNFWKEGNIEPYVSHLNVYSALHEANKFIGYDSTRNLYYNQVGYHDRKVTSIAFGTDKTHYYSASADGRILRWSLSNPQEIPETIYESNHIIKSIDISGDGKWILAAFYQTGLALISVNGKDDIEVFEDPEPIQTAIFIPNEQQYLSVSKNGALKIKSFKNDTQHVGNASSDVKSLEIDESDGTIYAGTASGILETWSKPYDSTAIAGLKNNWDQQSYFGYELGEFGINCMDISNDGKLMAIGRERGDVIIWDIKAKELARIISSHQSAITDISFSPNNEFLLTTSRDRTARLWDLSDSRKLPIILDDHEDWVLTGSFDPSGQQIITGSSDNYLRTWPVDPKILAERLCTLVQRNLSEQEWIEFVGPEIPFEKTCGNLDLKD